LTELSGRLALVTGGAGGLGREIALGLARAGARVAVNYAASCAAAEELAAEIGGLAVQADVADVDAVERMVRDLGAVDVLVNNAGITEFVPYDELDRLTDETWRRILEVNVLGAFHCARAAARGMRDRGFGAIVKVSSDSALSGLGSSIPYTVSKGALNTLTTALAHALAPSVRVNAVCPGWMDTPWLDKYVPADRREAYRSGARATVPVAEVAAVVVELATGDETGRIVRVEPEEPR
jgi:NAD(P)-dependent dehydrogenase (short-subunit alcohol dehydrogenase family)